jgi:recombinational DNA repair ATPase RecF
MSVVDKQAQLHATRERLLVVNQEKREALAPLKEQISQLSAPFDQERRELRVKIESLMQEILEDSTKLPMFRLDVSRTWKCTASPIEWCVYADSFFDSCVFCREPEERK